MDVVDDVLTLNGHALDLTDYRGLLVEWGPMHFRPFPWRETRDPYRLLMAEYMLLRTQASQVAHVYDMFIERYPTVKALSGARRDEVRSALYSLGLIWRADYVYDAAQEIANGRGGEVPRDRESLLALPGVSQYIAAAVRCFAFGETEGLIDTNTVRIAARLFGLEVRPHTRRSKLIRVLLPRMADPVDPRTYNFAMLDLAARVCTSRQPPDCPACPLRSLCVTGSRLTPD